MINRIVRNGLVAVIHADGYGTGWFSYHGIEDLLFDPQVVSMIESDSHYAEIYDYCELAYPEFKHGYFSDIDLTLAWVPVGTQFRIQEYDGLEHVVLRSQDVYLKA